MRVTPDQKKALEPVVRAAFNARRLLDEAARDLSKHVGCSIGEALLCVRDCLSEQDLSDRLGIEVLPETPTYRGP